VRPFEWGFSGVGQELESLCIQTKERSIRQRLVMDHGLLASMSRKGHCGDNAVVESFFHTLKTELVKFEDYHTRNEARSSLFEYIELFYNRVRRHSTLNYRSPIEFENINLSSKGLSVLPG
jgi:transposase InsO family protein